MLQIYVTTTSQKITYAFQHAYYAQIQDHKCSGGFVAPDLKIRFSIMLLLLFVGNLKKYENGMASRGM
jgi:hypothetical protein